MSSTKRKTPFTSTPSRTPAKRPTTAFTSAAKSKPGGNSSILSFFKKVDGPPPPPDNRDGNGDLRRFGFTKGSRPGRSSALGVDLFFLDDGEDHQDSLSMGGDSPKARPTSRASVDEDMMDLFGPASTQEQREILEREDTAEEFSLENDNTLPAIVRTYTPPPIEHEDACPFSFDDPVEESPVAAPVHRVAVLGETPVTNPFAIEEGIGVNSPSSHRQLSPPPPSAPEPVPDEDGFIEDEGMENFDEEQGGRWRDADDDDDDLEDGGEEIGEERMNRRYMEQEELDEAAFLASLGPTDETGGGQNCLNSCPVCDVDMTGYLEDVVSRHVNGCLDGTPVPLPPRELGPTSDHTENLAPKPLLHPPRRPQPDPFPDPSAPKAAHSAFTKIMTSNTEDRAWKAAADDEARSRGKRSFHRTCPFYKILPNLKIAVDAFRYGAVEGTNAYFLSHFHSDHYVGLSSSWNHGPIYCSRVTANLCRRQLRVDPQYIKELEYEKQTEIPGTEGATVTMIDANHCPGSSLFLFEKSVKSPSGRRLQRILHCGDFRASAKHLRHPLLSVLKKNKIDICYLDTTYLNPKYSFPPQKQVIEACMELCVSLDREVGEGKDMGFGEGRVPGGGIEKFTVTQAAIEDPTGSKSKKEGAGNRVAPRVVTKGKLLVVVGTYSIGKERICMGIARALGSKIYAPQNKQRICAALEDAELNSRLTTDPYAAQVHMTPLMEIRPETLREYLASFKQRFTKILGFRPSGWNYRPPNTRFVESPAVQTVLHSPAWKSEYSVAQMVPQRGSTADVKCFGVPYSEHSSFRELTAFCCALDIGRIIPTVNVGSAKSREKMKAWFEKWAAEKKKNGFYTMDDTQDVL
ncbi:hypothetical protein DRE_03699 [Drechslerella stenobrocha 248]|uniref:DNA repair metallo-beta-lactamase domain-containing protein n=1 Tax=Drechslerella stenobrocha 248 TaxID=1043628 RepID=W7I3G2_9PEZI|nr:hypothetical protein DRE_03699 [Drechslerella stenobrocha 248]